MKAPRTDAQPVPNFSGIRAGLRASYARELLAVAPARMSGSSFAQNSWLASPTELDRRAVRWRGIPPDGLAHARAATIPAAPQRNRSAGRGWGVTGWEGTIVRASSAARDDDFTAWMERDSDRLARFALYVPGNREDAQDVLQDVLAAIHSRYDRLAAHGGVGAYARRAISNAAVSRWRKGRRHVLFADVDGAGPDHADQTTDSVLAWRLCSELVEALRTAGPAPVSCSATSEARDDFVLRLVTAGGVREVFIRPNGCGSLTGGTSPRVLTLAVCRAIALPPAVLGRCTG